MSGGTCAQGGEGVDCLAEGEGVLPEECHEGGGIAAGVGEVVHGQLLL